MYTLAPYNYECTSLTKTLVILQKVAHWKDSPLALALGEVMFNFLLCQSSFLTLDIIPQL